MSDPILSGVKPGDKICITWELGGTPYLATVDRVTPSGRVITEFGTFRPNGCKHGDHNGRWNRCMARPATADDIVRDYRSGLIHTIEHFRRWDKFNTEDLKAIAALVGRYVQHWDKLNTDELKAAAALSGGHEK